MDLFSKVSDERANEISECPVFREAGLNKGDVVWVECNVNRNILHRR